MIAERGENFPDAVIFLFEKLPNFIELFVKHTIGSSMKRARRERSDCMEEPLIVFGLASVEFFV